MFELKHEDLGKPIFYRHIIQGSINTYQICFYFLVFTLAKAEGDYGWSFGMRLRWNTNLRKASDPFRRVSWYIRGPFSKEKVNGS